MPVNHRLLQRWQAWVAGGAICSEMEASTIFVLSSIYRKRAGGVMLIYGEDLGDPQLTDAERAVKEALFDVQRAVQTAVEALNVLIVQDRAQGRI
jgi:uridine phosphorylase